MQNEEKNKTKCVKLVCNLTNTSMGIYEDYYNKKVEQYGNEDNLKKYYIQNKIIRMIRKGTSIEDLAKLFNFELDESKKSYYSELIDFHTKNNSSILKVQPKKESKTTFIETDERVKTLINKWKNGK